MCQVRIFRLVAGVVVLGMLWVPFLSAAAETDRARGIQAVAPQSGETDHMQQVELYDRLTAVIIGIDRYPNLDPDQQLSGAVQDARGVADVLRKYYAFEQIQTLYNEEATRENIIKVLQGQLTNVNMEDGVLIYFAGHGVTQPTSQKRDLGFLIPYDGSLKKDQMYKNISMQQIKTDITPMIPAKHVLVIADACFGGLLLDTRSASTEAAHNLAYLREITAEPVRQIITAGGKGQMVLDNGPGGHSVFTGRLIEALKEVEDFVTAKELGVRLQKTVYGDAMSRGHQQRPQVGELYGTGDFVFVPDMAKRRENARQQVADLEAELAQLQKLKKQAAQSKEQARARELERQQLLKEAALKQARLREKAAQEEAARKKALQKKISRDKQQQAEQEKARQQRIAALKQKTRKMLVEMGGSATAALDLAGAQKEVKSIRASMDKVSKKHQQELNRDLKSLKGYYKKQIAQAEDIPPYDEMFETKEDYEKRKKKSEAEIQALEEERVKKVLERYRKVAELQEDLAPLNNQIREITQKIFPINPSDISYQFIKYNPQTEKMKLSCVISGARFSGYTQIPKKKARLYYENPDVLVPEASVQVTNSGGIYPVGFFLKGGKNESYDVELFICEDDLGLELVYVPGGCFEMGCWVDKPKNEWVKAMLGSKCEDDEFPVHTVCVDGFYMSRFEVTQAQWKKIMGHNPAVFGKRATTRQSLRNKTTIDKKDNNFPVENVSWEDIQEFIKRLNQQLEGDYYYRLPTEAEWEYAARSGGNKEKYPGQSNLENPEIDELAWYSGNSRGRTHPVGQKKPNGLGLYDMSGNVYEMCEDVYDPEAYIDHARNNPWIAFDTNTIIRNGSLNQIYKNTKKFDSTVHVIRGGCWKYSAYNCRSTMRNRIGSEYKNERIGFRLVR